MNFKEVYNNVTDRTKLMFLDAITKNNISLQQEFINYTKPNKNEPIVALVTDNFFKKIESTTKQYVDLFESVDTENPDWDNYKPEYSGYIEEWEQYQQASEQEFARFFSSLKAIVIDKIIEQDIDEFVAQVLGLYEACLNAEIVDEVGSFDDVNDHLVMEHTGLMEELVAKIKLSAITPDKVERAIELFFKYCETEYPGNHSFPKYFEPLILCLVDFSDNPGEILNMMKNSGIDKVAMPQLVLLLNKKGGNTATWLENAETLYGTDTGVAKQLLEYYFENNQSKFVEIANRLFKENPGLWAEFLKELVSEQIDKELFFKVFYFLTIREYDIKYYLKIRSYLNEQSFQELVDEFKYHLSFAVEILNVEKKYGIIKQIVTENIDDYHFDNLIRPILNVYPEFCFNTIATKLQNKLSKERGRHAYQSIAETLKLTTQIKGFKQQTRILIMQLYNNKPSLPALRDEFRQAGLV